MSSDAISVMEAAATPPPPLEELVPAWENFLGFLTLTCFIVGTAANLLAVFYFVQERSRISRNRPGTEKKLFFTELYLCMAGVDAILTMTLFPLFENYFTNTRRGKLFNYDPFCLVWGFLWEIAPCISVFLVGLLSFSRMLILVRPMVQLRINWLRLIIGSYITFHFVFRMVLWFTDKDPWSSTKIQYTESSGYCYFYPEKGELWKVNAYLASISLGAPVLPIFLSFTASLVKLRQSAVSGANQNFNPKAQTQATITIIIVTCVYLVCNMPIFVNYLWYAFIIATDDDSYTKYSAFYKGTFFGTLVWNIAYCVLVALNSALNPIVFVLRMKPFQEFLWGLWRKQAVHAPAWPSKSVKTVHTLQGAHIKDIVTTSSF